MARGVPAVIVVLMGVAGSGKTSVGRRLAADLGWRFVEGDDLHGEASRAKMAAGIALEDADRWPWLDDLGTVLAATHARGASAVATCSALRRAYRDRLRARCPRLRLVHLVLPAAVLAERLGRRQGHYMPASLLPSQLATLEPPAPDEAVIEIDGDRPLDEIIGAVRRALGTG